MFSNQKELQEPIVNDPDYEEIHINRQSEHLKSLKNEAKEATVKKISKVIEGQITLEIQAKQKELEQIELNLQESHQVLDQLRACIVSKFYTADSSKLNGDEREQSSVHPAVKKYSGKYPACFRSVFNDHDYLKELPEVFLIENEDTCLSRVQKKFQEIIPEKKPTVMQRVKKNVSIVVGNISKYLLSDNHFEKDQTTHKWMVYVRLKNDECQIGFLVKKVIFLLHPSYKPNDLVEIRDPPFYLCRRGWGEFPIRVQIIFKDPQNKPLDVIHNLKLDKTFTGLQTFGAETVIEMPLMVSEETTEPAKPANQIKEVVAKRHDLKTESANIVKEEMISEEPVVILKPPVLFAKPKPVLKITSPNTFKLVMLKRSEDEKPCFYLCKSQPQKIMKVGNSDGVSSWKQRKEEWERNIKRHFNPM